MVTNFSISPFSEEHTIQGIIQYTASALNHDAPELNVRLAHNMNFILRFNSLIEAGIVETHGYDTDLSHYARMLLDEEIFAKQSGVKFTEEDRKFIRAGVVLHDTGEELFGDTPVGVSREDRDALELLAGLETLSRMNFHEEVKELYIHAYAGAMPNEHESIMQGLQKIGMSDMVINNLSIEKQLHRGYRDWRNWIVKILDYAEGDLHIGNSIVYKSEFTSRLLEFDASLPELLEHNNVQMSENDKEKVIKYSNYVTAVCINLFPT